MCAVPGAHFLCIPEVAMPVKVASVKVKGISVCAVSCVPVSSCVFLIGSVLGTSVKIQGLSMCVQFPVYISCVFLRRPCL